jgi:hypothetical protein
MRNPRAGAPDYLNARRRWKVRADALQNQWEPKSFAAVAREGALYHILRDRIPATPRTEHE